MKIKREEMPFADWLRAWRERMGLSQSKAAKALEVNFRTLQGWESGRPCGIARLVKKFATSLEGATEPPGQTPRRRNTKSAGIPLDDWDML